MISAGGPLQENKETGDAGGRSRIPQRARQATGRAATSEGILSAVRAHPGIPIGELRRQLSIGWGTFYHHLNRLAAEGLISTAHAGRRKLVFPEGHRAKEESAALGILRGRTARRVAEAFLDRTHRSMDDLIATLDLAPRSVYYHVRRLIDAGLVRSASETRYKDLEATRTLKRILLQWNRQDSSTSSPSSHPSASPEPAATVQERDRAQPAAAVRP